MAEQNLDIVVRVRGGQVASSQIRSVGGAVQNVGNDTESANKKTKGLSQTLKGMATAATAYKAFNYIKGAVTDTARLAKSTAGLSRLTGFDSQQSAGWLQIAHERGIGAKQLNQGFISLNKNIAAGAAGSKSANRAFQGLGLDAAALKAVDAKTRMGMLADSFKALPPGIDKASLAQKLFGRQAQGMLPIINQSAKGLNEQVDALGKQTGMTGDAAKSALEFVKMQREWGATQMQLKVAIGTALMPVLAELAKALMPLIQAFSNAMTHSGAFRFVVIALTAALAAFVAVMLVGSAAVAGWTALAVGIGVALVMLYQKCGWFRNAINAVGQAAVAAFGWIKNAVIGVFNWVKANWPLLVSILGGPMAAAAVQVIKHWNDIKGAGQSVLNFLKGLVSFIGGAFAGAWNTAAGAVNAVASAIGSVVSTAQKIGSLPGKALKALDKMAGGGVPFIPGVQQGGTITSAGVALVGEAGPELVHLPTGATVTPNHMLGRGGGAGRVVVPVYLDTRQIAVAFGDYTADQQAAR
jgi:hypothetical protein